MVEVEHKQFKVCLDSSSFVVSYLLFDSWLNINNSRYSRIPVLSVLHFKEIRYQRSRVIPCLVPVSVLSL